MYQSMILEYKPASEPLHISVKCRNSQCDFTEGVRSVYPTETELDCGGFFLSEGRFFLGTASAFLQAGTRPTRWSMILSSKVNLPH